MTAVSNKDDVMVMATKAKNGWVCTVMYPDSARNQTFVGADFRAVCLMAQDEIDELMSERGVNEI